MGSKPNERVSRSVRVLLLTSFILAVAAVTGCSAAEPGPHPESTAALSTADLTPVRPHNILLLIADDMGVDQVSAYSENKNSARTPNIDALAKRGVMFRNTWSNPVCSSTRATILTGRYGFRTGVGFVARHGEDLKDREYTLPEILALHPSANYQSAAIGKWHLNAGRNWEEDRQVLAAPIRAGFSYFAGTFKNIVQSYFGWLDVILVSHGSGQVELAGRAFNAKYNTTEIVDRASAWIRDVETKRPDDPWFAWVAFNAGHSPFHKPPGHLHSVDLSAPSLTCMNPPPFRDPGNLEPCYRAMIEAMDTEIGRLLNEGISPESLARTTVIFVGDNGSVKGIASDPARAFRSKGTTYERGINVPLVIAGAGVDGNAVGRESDALVNTVDLFATIVELAKLDVNAVVPARYPSPHSNSRSSDSVQQEEGAPVVLDSRSLLPILASSEAGAKAEVRRFAYAELFKKGLKNNLFPVSKAIRDTSGYKLIRTDHEVNGVWRDRLYKLDVDPEEEDNLIGDNATDESRQAHLRLSDAMDNIESTGWSPRETP